MLIPRSSGVVCQGGGDDEDTCSDVFLVLMAGQAFAQCSDNFALQNYNDVRDNKIPALENLSAGEIEFIRSAYAEIESGVLDGLVHRSGAERYGASTLMPVLSNAGSIASMISSDPDVQLAGALGILNNTAWKFVRPANVDEMAKQMIAGLDGSFPSSVGVLQDRINRMHLMNALRDAGCESVISGLPAYDGYEAGGIIYTYRDVCPEIDFSSMTSAFSMWSVVQGCTGAGGDEDHRGLAKIDARVYRTVEMAEREFMGSRSVIYFGASSYDASAGLFAEESVRWDVVDELSAHSVLAIYRSGNLIVSVELSVSSIYNDVPVKRMHLSSMLDPFARQVFSLMWSLP